MFSFFRNTPKWQSDKAQKRIESLRDLNPQHEADRQILYKLACEDSDITVRVAAMHYLVDIDTLLQVVKRDTDTQVREAAVQQLKQLLSGNNPTLSLDNRLAQLARINHTELLKQLVLEANELEVRLAALGQLQDEALLELIALESPIARIRQAAAEKMTSIERLDNLSKQLQHKDKTVYRILRGRLEAHHQQEKQSQQLREKQEALIAAMEAHARAAFNPLYAAKTESLRQQWQDLNNTNIESQIAERFETAFRTATQQIHDIAAAEQRIADESRAATEQQQCIAVLNDTLKTWQGQDDFDTPALAALLKTQQLRWEFANQLKPANNVLAERYQTALESLKKLEQLLLQWQTEQALVKTLLSDEQGAVSLPEETQQKLQSLQQAWLQNGLPLPDLLQKALGLRPQKRQKAEPEALQQLNQLLNDISHQLKKGNSRDSSRLLRKARDLAKAQQLHSPRLAELADQVRELQSWAGFAILPKKEALISQMRELGQRNMDPDDKADAIHALQEEWKSLGVIDHSSEQPLWEQFKSAADDAFEPCRQYFSEQREIRQKNLESRRALCQQLQNYLDNLPESPDWKAHEMLMHTARQEWQKYHPSDRQETKALKERFDALLKSLDAPLQNYRQHNEQLKKALITKAEILMNDADIRQSCEAAKQLQLSWKQVGPAYPKADRELWQRFRKACDAVFARRDADFQAKKAEKDANVSQAEQLIVQITDLVNQADALQSAAIDDLSQSFQALQLPKESVQDLRDRFFTARRKAEQRVKDQHLAAQHEKQNRVLADWLALAQDDSDSQQALNLLLDLEILLNLDSPEPLLATRQARQMQQLQERGLRRAGKEEANKLFQTLIKTPIHCQDSEGASQRLRVILQHLAT